jgi:cell division protein FtsA
MEYIAVLDIGTSKMIALAASRDDRKRILAVEQIESGGSIRRGLIDNPAAASLKVVELVRRLNLSLTRANLPALKQIYLGIGGQGLHTQPYTVEKDLGGQPVDDEMIDGLRNQSDWDPSFDLLSQAFFGYFVDGQFYPQPQGMAGEKLEVRSLLTLGHHSKFRNEVEKALENANIELADGLTSPVATATFVLTPDDKDVGCALIEAGAGLTYVSIYKTGALRHLIALPFGGDAITRDITSLGKTEEEAETLKISEGDAFDEDKSNEINPLIRARAMEIIANILHQIKEAGYENELPAGFVLTGGGSRLKGFDKLLKEQTGRPVRRVEEAPEQSCARGLLLLGKEHCGKEVPVTKPVEPPKPPTLPLEGGSQQSTGGEKEKKEKTEKKGGQLMVTLERWAGNIFDHE